MEKTITDNTTSKHFPVFMLFISLLIKNKITRKTLATKLFIREVFGLRQFFLSLQNRSVFPPQRDGFIFKKTCCRHQAECNTLYEKSRWTKATFLAIWLLETKTLESNRPRLKCSIVSAWPWLDLLSSLLCDLGQVTASV